MEEYTFLNVVSDLTNNIFRLNSILYIFVKHLTFHDKCIVPNNKKELGRLGDRTGGFLVFLQPCPVKSVKPSSSFNNGNVGSDDCRQWGVETVDEGSKEILSLFCSNPAGG